MTEFTNNYFKNLENSDEKRYGYWYAFRAYRKSVEKKADYFTLDCYCLNNERPQDVAECLRAAGVTEFAITDESTALMDMLHDFAEAGCQMKGLCKVHTTENRWGVEESYTTNGILMSL